MIAEFCLAFRDLATRMVEDAERVLKDMETDPRLIDERWDGSSGQASARLAVAIAELKREIWLPFARQGGAHRE